MPPRSRARAASNASATPATDSLRGKAAATTLAMASAPAVKPAASLSPLLTHTADKIPSALRFPILVLLSYAVGLIAHQLVALFAGSADLRAVSRHFEDPWLIAAALIWRIAELAVGWFTQLDARDALYLTLLTHLPQTYLLHTFYLVPISSTLTTLLISALSTYAPFRLFLTRPYSRPYAFTTAFLPLQVYVTLLASAVYALPLLLSLTTWLPTHLILHFDGLRTLDPAHDANLAILVSLMLPTGFLASRFLFDPLASPALAAAEQLVKQAGPDDGVETAGTSFDPVTATLVETLAWNLLWWRRYSPRGRELVRRMLLLVIGTGACAGMKAWAEVKGVDAQGAVGWAAVWIVGAGASGGVLGWVGDAW
ncbi:hypothetical protein FH972_026217 [Carpinus fangiana]|uniref:Uncharacterized protein n=1 Tax=Carpinus fangiana TaxID=176857 RepID=A0A5N6L3B0_9ROSI|nr:hypothetical protein FH972_026217 [Carpinus fangiana]